MLKNTVVRNVVFYFGALLLLYIPARIFNEISNFQFGSHSIFNLLFLLTISYVLCGVSMGLIIVLTLNSKKLRIHVITRLVLIATFVFVGYSITGLIYWVRSLFYKLNILNGQMIMMYLMLVGALILTELYMFYDDRLRKSRHEISE